MHGTETEWASIVTATPSGQPTNVEATSGILQSVVSWDDVANADSYTLEYRGELDTNWTSVADVTSPYTVALTVPDDEPFHFYDLRVGAVYSGETAWSAVVENVEIYPAAERVTNLTVAQENASLTVTWTPAPSYVFQRVFVRQVGVTGWSDAATHHCTTNFACNGVTSVTVTKALHTGASARADMVNGTEYEVLIRSEFDRGRSPLAKADASIKGTPSATPSPGNVVATSGILESVITWDAVPDADSYTLEYRAEEPATWTSVADVTSPHTQALTVPADESFHAYDFRVGSVDDGATEWSAVVENRDIYPAAQAATGLTATPGNQQLALSWTQASSILGQEVYVRQAGVTTWPDAAEHDCGGDCDDASSATMTQALHQGDSAKSDLVNGTEYEVLVRSQFYRGSDPIVTTDATVSGTPIPAPDNVAVASGNGSLTVTWTNATGADSHSVRHREKDTTSWTELTSQRSPVTVESLKNGTEYEVQVGAVKGGVTVWAATVTATPTATPPPHDVAVLPGKDRLQVSWTNAEDADSHSVRRRVKTPTGSWTLLTSQSSPVTIESLNNGTEYEVQVGAVYGTETEWASIVSATPSGAPRNVKATAGSGLLSRELRITWDNPVGGADSYTRRHRVKSPPGRWITRKNQTSQSTIYRVVSESSTKCRWARCTAPRPSGRTRSASGRPEARPLRPMWSWSPETGS